MCPMCMIRAALVAMAAVSTGGLATYVAARWGQRKRAGGSCSTCENRKER